MRQLYEACREGEAPAEALERARRRLAAGAADARAVASLLVLLANERRAGKAAEQLLGMYLDAAESSRGRDSAVFSSEILALAASAGGGVLARYTSLFKGNPALHLLPGGGDAGQARPAAPAVKARAFETLEPRILPAKSAKRAAKKKGRLQIRAYKKAAKEQACAEISEARRRDSAYRAKIESIYENIRRHN